VNSPRPSPIRFALLLAAVLSPATQADDTLDDAGLLTRARSEFGILQPPAAPPGPAAILGRSLFWDARVSANGKTACASCHHATDWGADHQPFSLDARGKWTARNSQTVFNAMRQPALRWTSDRKSGAHQAERSLTGSMGFTNAAAVVPLLQQFGYEAGFRKAWPDDADPVSVPHYAEALEAYQATLITPAPFDRYLAGDATALSASQREGLRAFLSKGCADCHDGALLGGRGLRKFGVRKPYVEATRSSRHDTGLHETSKRDEDKDLFRVPMLRNITRTGPYFHDGSVTNLTEAVQIMADVQLGARMPSTDAAAIVSFLDSLTGSVPENFRAP
jgi:cytochrome c peroxidase